VAKLQVLDCPPRQFESPSRLASDNLKTHAAKDLRLIPMMALRAGGGA
jgi:hypothetical protein